MDDRQLLEAAAKAAGLWDAENECIDIPWDARRNSTDAFALSVKLRMDIHYETQWDGTKEIEVVEILYLREEDRCLCEMQPLGEDPADAVRRAIVNVAAAIWHAHSAAAQTGLSDREGPRES